jgi:hypothetical protein
MELTTRHWLIGSCWLRTITKLTARWLFNWPLFFVVRSTMEDTTKTEGLEASAQILQSFQHLAPLLGVKLDKDLTLAPNPAQTKRPRQDVGPTGKGRHVKQENEMDQSQLQETVLLMAKILVRHDQQIEAVRREDTFIFFFNNQAPTGSLKCLLAAAETWHSQSQTRQTPWQPLRQRLLQVLLKDLLARLTQLGEAPQDSPLVQAAQMNNVLLPDQTCPYLDWDPTQKKLMVSKRPPISLKKMVQNIQELQEMSTEVTLVQAFHALPPSGEITPWRLQLSLRADREYWLMRALCGSSIWVLMASSLKAHSLHQSSLVNQLSRSLNLRPSKGKSKGKPIPASPTN